MQQIVAIWNGLTLVRRVAVGAATLAMFAAILLMARGVASPRMTLLYSGLEPAAAGQVVNALAQRGITHDVRGDAIYVPEQARDQLRMALAAEGMPANSGGGYEILDSLSGFGTTSQMFDAAYWRAREGELARTILSSNGIRAARVHIATARTQPFRQDMPPTASVTVTTSGMPLAADQARAMRFLVSSAVPGMLPEAVSVIDSQRGLILSGVEPPGAGPMAERTETLRHNILRLLEARLGPGRAVAEVSLDIANERETITERRIDPASRIAVSHDAEETTASSSESPGAPVGVASNLPDGEAKAEGGSSRNQDSRSRERTNFDFSQTERAVERAPGALRRLTVAVLVDGVQVPGADGTTTWQPLPETEIAALRDLVASTVGYDEARGDVITLKSMPFQPVDTPEMADEKGLLSGLDAATLVKPALLGLFALLIGLFVIRPIFTGARKAGRELDDSRPVRILPAGETLDGTGLPAPAEISQPEEPVHRLRRLIAERQDETVEILRGWLEDRKERV